MVETRPNSIRGNQDIAEGTVDAQPAPLRLSQQQRDSYEALLEKDRTLARIYLGALLVLSCSDHPDRLALAAHALRELMEKIPSYVDVQMKAHREHLGTRDYELQQRWEATHEKTHSRMGLTWRGSIDEFLSQLLGEMDSFFAWYSEHFPRRRAEVISLLRRLDDSGCNLPEKLEELSAQEWMKMRDFFVHTAHHRRFPSDEEFAHMQDALERFLLDRLRPRTFADFDTIDRIIYEGESDA